jgi:DNA-binding CsgD family transcriptional regulator
MTSAYPGDRNAPGLSADQRARPGQPLTEREVQALSDIANGAHVFETARAMGMSQRTVRRDLRAAEAKLGARTLTHAAALAAARGLITVEPPVVIA